MSEAYLADFPTATNVWLKRGTILTTLWRYEEALEHFENALELDVPQLNSTIWREKGELYRKSGDFVKAIGCFLQATSIDVDQGYSWSLVGETELLCGDVEQAEKTLRYALTLDSEDEDLIYDVLGRVLTALQRYDEAAACYERTLELYPGHFHATQGLSELRVTKERQMELSSVSGEELLDEDAEAFPLLFLSRFPSHLRSDEEEREYSINCGRALGKLCRYEEAEDFFKRALSDKEDDTASFAWYCQGWMERQRGDYLAARKCFTRAQQIHTSVYSELQLGITLVWSGQITEAEQVLRHSLGLNEHAITFYYLGRALSNQKRYAEAAQCFRDALNIRPKSIAAKVRLLDVEHVLRWQQRNNP